MHETTDSQDLNLCCGQWPNYMDKYVCSGINTL